MTTTLRWLAIPAIGLLLASAWIGDATAAEQTNPARTVGLSTFFTQDMAPLPQSMPSLGLTAESPAAVPAPGGNCADGSCDGGVIVEPCFQPMFSVSGGVVMLTRASSGTPSLVTDAGTGNELLNMHDIELGSRVGPRAEIGFHAAGWDLEFVFFSVDGFNTGRQYTQQTTTPLFPGVTLDTLDVRYYSRLYNWELNVKTHLHEQIDGLIGFRWIQLDESLDGSAMSGVTPGSVSQTVANNLYGLQIGVEGRVFNRCSPFQITGYAKAGVFGAHQSGSYYYEFGVVDPTSSSFDRVSFAGEVGVSVKWQISRNFAALGGYQALWIDGVTLAPDALLNSELTPNTTLYHGAYAGLEYRW